MIHQHLTDDALQSMLLEEGQNDAAAAHLSECPECQQKWQAYQALMAGFHSIPEAPTFDITASVMDKIMELENRKEKSAHLLSYLGLALVTVVGLVLIYPYLQMVIMDFKNSSAMVNAFLLITAVGVMLFLLQDSFRRYRQKEMLLSQ